MDTILVLDFGGQTCQLIARRIRECGVFSRVLPGDVRLSEVERREEVRGIVLSGSPASVYDAAAPAPDPAVLQSGVPVLGICYGMQHLMQRGGGSVSHVHVREYGQARVDRVTDSALFSGIPASFRSWMSHGDAVERIAPGFRQIAGIAAWRGGGRGVVAGGRRRIRSSGCSFTPRLPTPSAGAGCWTTSRPRSAARAGRGTWKRSSAAPSPSCAATVGSSPVVLMISGGVDSTVVAALLLRALPAAQVHLLYVDTGLMRLRETAEVRATLQQLGAVHVQVVDAAARFYAALAGVTEPERKRRIIGDLFIEVQRSAVPEDLAHGFLAQGTLYTDLIESGSGVGDKAEVIKSHHNVAAPLVAERRAAGLLLEPLASLYKDEVRRLGRVLGVPPRVLQRHPFPGPGLAVRILGEVTRDRCDLLRAVDAIYLEELQRRDLYRQVTQAFAVLLPVRSVGVTGDRRNYGEVVALRAVVSDDFMTAEVYRFEMEALLAVSARITNEVTGVGRVVYDVSSKPPATVEWE